MPSYRFSSTDSPARRGSDKFIDTHITGASYMQNDRGLRPIYKLEDLSSKFGARDFDYAPTVLSTDFSERNDAIGREILQMYAQSGQGEDIGVATRLAIDATIAGALGLDYRDVARNHSYYVSMFAGEDVEDRGFLEALGKSWERDGVEQDIARLQNRFDSSDDDDERRRILKDIEDLELKSLQLQDYTDRGWLGNTAVNTMPIIRQMSKTIAYTAIGAALGAGIGGLASGTLSTAASVGNLMKGLTLLNASNRAVRIGANAGRVVDAVVNTYARERGSLSRRLYNLVDENGNRLSDEVRNGAATTYGILSSMVEYFLPEPGLEKIVPNGLSLFMKKSLADVIQNQAKRYGARIFLGAVSESTEEAVQSLLADWKETEAKMISNAYGITEFRGRPLSEAIGDYLGNAWESFKEAFLPSLIAGLPGATFTSASEAYHNVSMNGSLRRSTPDEMAAAQEAQTVGDYDKVVPSSLLRYKRGKPSQSFMESIRPAEGEGASDSKLPSVKVKKTDNGYFEPIDDYNRDLAKYLYNKGLKGISVSIVNEDAFVEAGDLGGAVELHGGFYDPDTNAVYLGSQQDADAAIGELGDSVVSTEKVDDMTTRVRYRNADGTETTVDFIADPALADVLSGNEEAEETQPSQPLDTARMDSWLSRGDEWYSDGGLTSEMASEIRRSPENAREIMRSGLYAYIRRAVPGLSEAEANALADSNAFLMQSLASAQGRDAASFVEGLMGFGTVDGNVRGQFRSADGQSRIFLNPNEASPTTLSHEIGHYFLITLPDGAVKDRIISAFRSEYEADGNTIGTNMQEAFSRGLTDYIATGQAQNAEVRTIFQRLMDAMRRFVDRVFVSGGMTAEQKALYDSFFDEGREMQSSQINGEMTFNDLSAEGREIVLNEDIDPREDNDYHPKKTGVGYKVFYMRGGKLYPPMVANSGGKETPVGVWLMAEAPEIAGYTKTGRPQVKAGGKGTNASGQMLAYRPGWHLGEIPYALQFAKTNPVTGARGQLFPADFIWAEVEFPMDVDYQEEAMSYGYNEAGKFQHSLAGLPKLPKDGYYRYRTNPNPNTDPWIITGAMRVSRVLTREEVDNLVREAGREPQLHEEDFFQHLTPARQRQLQRLWESNGIEGLNREISGQETVLNERINSLSNAVNEIVNGADEAIISDARSDLSKYGGSNDVKLIWGDKKKGLFHIGYRRGADVVANVLRTIVDGQISRYVDAKRTVHITNGEYEAVLSLDMNGKDETWLLTGWKINRPDAIGEVSTQSDATQTGPTFSRSDLGAGYSNVITDSESVNSGETILNEDISPTTDEQLRQEERDALRDRIRRGRAAQAQRRQRFFDNIGEMVRNNVYVDAEDIHTAMDNLPLDSELRKELQQELADRDRMLIFPDSAYEIARDGRDEASFIKYISEHSSDFTEDDRRIASKFYAYANTVRPEMQIQAFVDQYSSLSGLLSLKNIIGPRRVASRSQNGRVFTRLYVPRSNVWNELKGITRNSSAAEVDAVLSSIRSNTNEWYQAYLSSLISWAKTGRRTTEDTMNDLEAIAMSYYAGKDSPIQMPEALTRRQKSESDKDIDAAEKLVSDGEASSFTREESLSDTFIERVFPKAMTEIELERERAKAREAIGRSERAIRRMSSFAKADVDARFIPVAQWLYMFMHGGRTGIFTEVIGSSATEYQNILEGRADADQGDFFLYTTIEPDASGAATIIDRYGEMQEVSGFEANLGGAVFNQQEIPAELERFLSDETIEHIHSAPRWSALTASDITDIANAMRMAKRFAQDVQAEKKRERLAKARGISIPVASRIMKSRMEFSPLQLKQVGEALGLDGPATAYQAMDYYRRNPARIFDTGDDRPNTAIGKAFKGIRDKLTDGYLGFSKMQRVARMLDGEENGPIFNAFVRDVFESYQDMLRETQRRTAEAKAAFAPIIGDPDNPSLTREQRAAERKKRSAFMEMMSKTHELAASSAFDNERKTRTLTGFDIMQMYLSSKNINGFRKLIDPDKGSGIAIEALMEYAPEEVAEFVDLELRLREAIVSDRNRINEEWNQSELRKMEADPAFIPNFRDARMTWETMPSDFRKKSFIPGDTAYLESLLDRARNTESKLNPDVKALADKMLELLSKETKRIVEADYRQRNELMVIERNYWPLINTRRQLSQPIFGDKKEAPRISTFQGMLQQRNSQAVYDVIGLNPFAIFYSAIDAQERFINMGEAIRGLDNLFDRNGGNINEVLGQVYGDKFASYFRAYAERMAGKDEFNSLMGLEFLNGLLPRLQGSYIGLSPLTVVRQYVSLISTATRGETKKGQVLSTFFRYWKDRTFREEVDERIKALAPELANTDLTQEIGWQRRMEQMQFRSDEAAARFRDFTTSWIRYHDKATKYIAWEAVYENGIASGLSEQDAAFRASEAVQETQSVGDPVSRSPLQASKNPFVRYFFMFTTDIFNTWNILFGDAVSDFREGQIKRGAERIAGFLGVCTALALIQGGWLPDEDDDDERLFGFFDINGFMADFGGEFVNGLPIFGTVVSDAIQGYSGSVPFVSDTARNWRNLTGDDKDAMERLDALVDEAMVAAGAAFGFPTSSGRRAVNAIYTPQGGFAFNPLAFLNADWGNWWKTLMD